MLEILGLLCVFLGKCTLTLVCLILPMFGPTLLIRITKPLWGIPYFESLTTTELIGTIPLGLLFQVCVGILIFKSNERNLKKSTKRVYPKLDKSKKV